MHKFQFFPEIDLLYGKRGGEGGEGRVPHTTINFRKKLNVWSNIREVCVQVQFNF
jgi:hypothetical protein